MAVRKFVIPADPNSKKVVIYAEPANLNYFLKTPLVPVTEAGVSNKQVQVSAHQRRQYPGDVTKINVPAQLREVLVDPTRRSGAGLPGRSVVLVGDKGLPGEERRQFTVQGRWIDFHAFLVGNAKMELHAYNHTGAVSIIKAAA